MSQQSWLIGADPDCDIVVDRPTVSSNHCRLTQAPTGCILEDLDSTNGTFVNGQRVCGQILVTPGDRIMLGRDTPMPWPSESLLHAIGGESRAGVARSSGPAASPASRVQDATIRAVDGRPARARRRVEVLIGVVSVTLLCVLGLGGLRYFKTLTYRPLDSRELVRLQKHRAEVLCAAFSPDGKLGLTGDASGSLRLWDAASYDDFASLQGHTGRILGVAISPDGSRAASGGSDGNVFLWDLSNYKQVACFRESDEVVHAIAYYPAGTHVAAGLASGAILLWNVEDGEVTRKFAGHHAVVTCLEFTPDRRRLLSGGCDGSLRLWDVTGGNEVQRLDGHSGAVTGLALWYDGNRAISSGDDGTLILWDLKGGGDLAVLKSEDPERVAQKAVSLSPGGTRALSAGDDGLLRIWSCESNELLDRYRGHQSGLTSCKFFPNSLVCLSTSRDTSVRLWQMSPLHDAERTEMERAAREAETRAKALQRFGDHFQQARDVLENLHLDELKEEHLDDFDENQLDNATNALELARLEVEPQTLEHEAASDLANSVKERKTKIADAKRKKSQYVARCEAGKKALEDKDLDRAKQEFTKAQEIFPERAEAREGLEKIRDAQLLQSQVSGLKLVSSELTWDFEPKPGSLLDQGRDFAFLIFGRDPNPPIGLASSPMKWTLRMRAGSAWQEADVKLCVEMTQVSPERTLAKEDYLFEAGTAEQQFRGNVPPPSGGWAQGEYVFASSLIVAGEVRSLGDPKRIPVGLLRWQETSVLLTPQMVQKAGYAVVTDAVPDLGDGYRIQATGKVTPARASFYEDFLIQPRVREPPAAGPEGIHAAPNPRQEYYGGVDSRAPFAALLYRRNRGAWTAYQRKTPISISTEAGPLQLSINSITQVRRHPQKPPTPIKSDDESFWLPDSGAFDVSILVGKFDFPVPLNHFERIHLLKKFD